jgi:hypothetical protein
MAIIAWVTEGGSIKRSRHFAFPLRLSVQGTPSLACPFAGGKVHRTFLSIRLTLDYIGEPATPPPIASARDPPRWVDDIDQTPAYDPTLAQSAPERRSRRSNREVAGQCRDACRDMSLIRPSAGNVGFFHLLVETLGRCNCPRPNTPNSDPESPLSHQKPHWGNHL